MFNLILNSVPEPLHARARLRCEKWMEAAKANSDYWSSLGRLLESCSVEKAQFEAQLTLVFVGSEFASDLIVRKPELLTELLSRGELFRAFDKEDWNREFSNLSAALSSPEFDAELRRLRKKMMFRFIWRELQGNIPLTDRLLEISHFADLAIQYTANFHYQKLCLQYGTPFGNDSQKVQPFVILGMGKLGANELNLSSDIDLIFAFPESGSTRFTEIESQSLAYTKPSIENQEFFTKLGQQLIQSLDKITADGFVFRVDMRLRPYGQSGALALSYSALEDYYQSAGREWERFAMIKARTVCVVAGDLPSASLNLLSESEKRLLQLKLRQLLQPFTYRQYVDYSAIESLREMKALIARQVQKKSLQQDVKLGEGGIREIEFIVQVFQLIRGGRDPLLRRRQVMTLLPYLEKIHYLPDTAGKALLEAYQFLRNIEHLLQAAQDQQTQMLPHQPLDQMSLAWAMGFSSWSAFTAVLDAHRQRVHYEFNAVIADVKAKETVNFSALEIAKEFWQASSIASDLNRELLFSLFDQYGLRETVEEQEVSAILEKFRLLRESRALIHMQSASRERLELFVPRLLVEIIEHFSKTKMSVGIDGVCARFVPLVEAIARRSSYMVLLLENPIALKHLIKLCSASVMIANQICHYPALMDELLSPEILYAPPDKNSLRDELRREFLRIAPDDVETQMESLRYFRAAHGLRVAASEVAETLPLMKVSDYLSFLAEAILEQVLTLSWDYLTERHGFPKSSGGSLHDNPQFVIVAYGKLGGLELSHGSDLDLVFLHNSDSHSETSGKSSDGLGVIDNLSFYARLGQRIISLLNTNTQFGRLYEVDMRLRPSGNSGLLVSSVAAFMQYQSKSAWTWEHQALVRARPIAGSSELMEEFEKIRLDILCRERDVDQLRKDVREMRQKMRQQLSSEAKTKRENSTQFNLKQDAGGIVDIEFMVQYAALAWAHKAPEIVQYTDNIRILGSLKSAGILDADSTAQLIAAYKAYRSTGHRLVLQEQEAVIVGDHPFVNEREQVITLWLRLLESDMP